MMRLTPIVQAMILTALSSVSVSLQAAEAMPLLLAKVEQGQADVPLYLVSEKLDGVRAFWDGQVLRTRSGNTINAPAWFVEGFAAQALDGELWIGRGKFDRLSATVRRQVADEDEWRQVRFLAFELPQASGTFFERNQALRAVIQVAGTPWLQAVEQYMLKDRQQLKRKLDEIVRAGGEGLMLHRADAPYQTGRSDILLKMKPWNDAEAEVIAHQAGKGKYSGKLGALRVRTADGVEFMLGTGLSETDRRYPPLIGSVITFRYRELTHAGLPRFASYHRVQEI